MKIFIVVYHFHGISHAFQYTTINIICSCKTLLNKKKLKRIPKYVVLKGCRKFWWKEVLLKVDCENTMVPQLWLLK